MALIPKHETPEDRIARRRKMADEAQENARQQLARLQGELAALEESVAAKVAEKDRIIAEADALYAKATKLSDEIRQTMEASGVQELTKQISMFATMTNARSMARSVPPEPHAPRESAK